ncbi:MAG: GMC family oxidoreductase [Candidatus Sericytochromatia bacterium]|nr:GMC family oxidoreductase [Candidatus Tanganyikabacteria bacterium]
MKALPFHHPEHPAVVRDPAGPLTLEADVCVIGTGAGGSTLAAELAEGGLDVVMVEKGPYVTRADMTQRERDMMPLLFEDAGARTTRDGAILVWHGHAVGGTTVLNNAICFDPPDAVLARWKAGFGVEGASKADLAPSLAKARFVLGVQKIQEHEINRNAEVMMRGARKLGLKGDVFEHNRIACLQSGFCMMGCSYDRKQNHHITYVPRALSFGARLCPDTLIDKLELDGRRIARATGSIKNRKTGERHPFEIRARAFAVAGGAISTPALLLSNGLADSSGQVGRNLWIHPAGPVVAIMDEEIRYNRGIPQVYFVDALGKDGVGGFLLEAITGGPSQTGGMVPAFGNVLHATMKEFNHFAGAVVLAKDERPGSVTVSARGVPVVDYVLQEPDATTIRDGYQLMARIYLAAGARQVMIPHVNRAYYRTEADVAKIASLDLSPGSAGLYTGHQMGTCRMGEDPGKSVVDSGGKAHDLANLYVVDSSVFPTSLGVNPQITITTLATHFARRMLRDKPKLLGT